MKQEITNDPRWNIICTKFVPIDDDLPSLRHYIGWTAHWINTKCPVCKTELKDCDYIYWYRTLLTEHQVEYKPYCGIKCIIVDIL